MKAVIRNMRSSRSEDPILSQAHYLWYVALPLVAPRVIAPVEVEAIAIASARHCNVAHAAMVDIQKHRTGYRFTRDLRDHAIAFSPDNMPGEGDLGVSPSSEIHSD